MAWQGILLLGVVISVSAHPVHFKQRILSGRGVIIDDYPYQVSVRNGYRHLCGGSIIGEKHVLTAAHCVKNAQFPTYDNLTVVTGTTSSTRQRSVHKAASVTIHPDYFINSNRALNDIAVITLRDVIVFDKHQQKINLPEHDFKVGGKANVTGWGLIHPFIPRLPKRLQMIEAEIISREECQRKVMDPEKTKIYDTEVCTDHSSEKAVCSGDSGGPLAANGELVGIVSWTDGDYCDGKYPNVFTNVYKFKDFIKSVTN